MADEAKERARRARELAEHNRLMERGAAHASRDTLHDASGHLEPGAYTTQEARDRAAHTPPHHNQNAFSKVESTKLGAIQTPPEKPKIEGMDDEVKRKALLAAQAVKDVSKQQTLTAETAGTDQTRTSAESPGYQPKYGQTVTRISTPQPSPEPDKG